MIFFLWAALGSPWVHLGSRPRTSGISDLDLAPDWMHTGTSGVPGEPNNIGQNTCNLDKKFTIHIWKEEEAYF